MVHNLILLPVQALAYKRAITALVIVRERSQVSFAYSRGPKYLYYGTLKAGSGGNKKSWIIISQATNKYHILGGSRHRSWINILTSLMYRSKENSNGRAKKVARAKKEDDVKAVIFKYIKLEFWSNANSSPLMCKDEVSRKALSRTGDHIPSRRCEKIGQ